MENGEDEEELAKEADCTVTNITKDDYTLNCTMTGTNTYNIQSAVSIIDDGILLINFNDINDENQSLVNTTGDHITNLRNYSKESKEISSGAIVGIVFACIVAVATIISIVLCLRKHPNKFNIDDSTISKIQINN